MNSAEWVAYRGGPHLFPTAPDFVYREYCADISFVEGDDPWGEGMLDYARFEDPERKSVTIPEVPDGAEGEMLVFGTGVFQRPVWINGARLDLLTTAELRTEYDPYDGIGNTVHRAYQLAQIPANVLKPGVNEVRLLATHAFVQALVIRVYDRPPDASTGSSAATGHPSDDWALSGSQTDGDSSLLFDGGGAGRAGTIHNVDFFEHSAGPDFDLSGQPQSWQVWLNANMEQPGRYVLENTLSAGRVGDPGTWRLPLSGFRSGSAYRCRVVLDDGTIVESPGGIVQSDHTGGDHQPGRASEESRFVRADRFYPFGFHENGWHQDVRIACSYRVPHECRGGSWEVTVPHYGSVSITINDQDPVSFHKPTGHYGVSSLELPSAAFHVGTNTILLSAEGATGCFEPPGPVLRWSSKEAER